MRDIGSEQFGHCLTRVLSEPDFAAPALEVRGVKYFASSSTILDVPELTIAGRGITVLLGPNGAGKSLMVRLMHGLIAPQDGDVVFDDQSVLGAGRDRQAMVFQKPVLLRRSVLANLRFALKHSHTSKAGRDEKIEALIELAGLTGKEKQPARSLSGGEEQCLALACALARQPKMLFLDEPTSSLDPNATQRIEMILHQAAIMGVRIVMVSHDLAQAERLADEVIFVNRGRVAKAQSTSEFFDNPTSADAFAFLRGRLVL